MIRQDPINTTRLGDNDVTLPVELQSQFLDEHVRQPREDAGFGEELIGLFSTFASSTVSILCQPSSRVNRRRPCVKTRLQNTTEQTR